NRRTLELTTLCRWTRHHPWTGTPHDSTPMLIRRSASAVRVWTPAKVNLFLEVLARRPDGYHELATLMMAVSLYDTLEFTEEPSGATALHCDHPSLSTGPDNLICGAAATLVGLNRLWRLGWDRDRLVRLGAQLGSDVAFFVAPPPHPSPTRGE